MDKIRFICVDGDEQNLPFLRENTRNIEAEIVCAIVGRCSKDEHLTIERSPIGTSAIVATSRPTSVLALDDILKERSPDLIKIDTDGYDLQVLRGAARCLKNIGPPLFIEYSPHHIRVHGHEDASTIFTFLRSMGYTTTIFYDNKGYPISLLNLESRELQMIAQYTDAKPGFYGDLLVSKDRKLLERFYALDCKRFPPRNSFE